METKKEEKKIQRIALLAFEFHKKELFELLKRLSYENVHAKKKIFKKSFVDLEKKNQEPYIKFAKKIIQKI